MGRTLPSTTQMVFDHIAELEPFYLTLRRADQLVLDKFFEAILNHREAMTHTASLLPMEIFPFIILLEERKRLDQLHTKLLNMIEELESRLKSLSPPT